MENKQKDADNNESSLLLQMPRAMFSFSDMSGSSFLMPVAAVETDESSSSTIEGSQEEKDFADKSIEGFAVTQLCQLEQPLLMRKSSPAQHPQQPMTTQEYIQSEVQHPGSSHIFDKPQAFSSTIPVSSNVEFFQQPPPSTVHPYGESQNYFAPPDYYSQPTAAAVATTTVPNPYANEPVLSFSATNNNKNETNLFESDCQYYEPVTSYWLFQDIVESKEIWYGFSKSDSDHLEQVFYQDPHGVVATDGGRYDVDISKRIKKSVYFDGKDMKVRRCTWFYRTEGVQRFIPYEEDLAQLLEQHFYTCSTTGQWHKTLSLPGSGIVMMESPQVILHYSKGIDVWPAISDSKVNAKAAKRGLPEEIEFMPNESPQIDHLVFIVQGIGSFCDLRFRTVSQCVDGFRDIANRLIASHFKHEVEVGRIGRVEFLPLAWHAQLHTSNVAFDRRMQCLTLPSIPKLRHFTNDTLLDILLYSSPSYCQSILDTVASELNKLSSLFIARNPGFSGKISVAGHSLGSLILFDILAHQTNRTDEVEANIETISLDNTNNDSGMEKPIQYGPEQNSGRKVTDDFANVESLLEFLNLKEYTEMFLKEKIDLSTLPLMTETDLKELGMPKGPCKKLLSLLHSEVEINLTKSQIKQQALSIEENLEFPGNVENIFFQENESYESAENAILNTSVFPEQPPKNSMSSIIYPKLQFEPSCFFALGSPISMFLAVRGYETLSEDFRFPTCPAFFHIFHPYDPVAFRIEPLIDPNFSAKPVLIPHHKGRKRMHIEIRENLTKVGSEIKQKVIETLRYTWNSLSGFAKSHSFPSAAVEAEVEKIVKEQMSSQSEVDTMFSSVSEISVEDIQIGNLNGGRRIDFVLQEKPIEALNDYIFALTSHATYWDSEDTVLMILKEVYATEGVEPMHLPEQTPISASSSATFHLDQSSGIHNFQYQEPNMNRVEAVESIPLTNYSTLDSHFIASPQNYVPLTSEHIPNISTAHSAPSTQSLGPLPLQSIAPPPLQSIGPPPPQFLGPPPLSGFIRKSPFSK